MRNSTILLLTYTLLTAAGCSSTPSSTPVETLSGDQIVHCLLPPRIQKLGGIAYPTRRELAYESATRCELRGGEYTQYDRSTPASSASFYLSLAQDGNVEAQYNLALVYESLFSPANFPAAAQWYQTAADAGHQGAMKNLAYLYEKGLGVESNAMTAINLLRQSGGIDDDLVLASELEASRSNSERQLQALTHRLEKQNAESVIIRKKLADARKDVLIQKQEIADGELELAKLTNQLAAQVAQLGTSRPDINNASLARLQSQIDNYNQVLIEKKAAIENLTADLNVSRAQLSASETRAKQQLQQLNKELLVTKDELAQSSQTNQTNAGNADEARILRTKLAQIKRELSEQTQAHQQLLEQLSVEKNDSDQSEASTLRIASLEQEIRSRSSVITEQSALIQSLESNSAAAQDQITQLIDENAASRRENQLISAQLVATEQKLVFNQNRLAELTANLALLQFERDEVSKQSAALQTQLNANEELYRTGINSDDAERERLARQIASAKTSIRDRDETLRQQQQQIDDLNKQIVEKNRLIAEASNERQIQIAMRNIPRINYPTAPKMELPAGKRYALIIGNDSYTNLTPLKTAVVGARAMAQTMRERYGYEIILLTNATRRAISDAFSDIHSKLNEQDSLLIYYAGHGDIDPGDDKVGYWLGVEARKDKSSLATDGIASTWITEKVRAMRAKHVLIVADSCYAGAMVRPLRVTAPRMDLSEKRLSYMLDRRSRTVLTSGANLPVLDQSINSEHSVFTQALLYVLNNNPNVLYGEAIHAMLVDNVRHNAQQLQFDQVPQFDEIAGANHGNGQFVLKARG